ncbi:MAG TPA: exonuclease SbcCD subunit D [Actinomycetota bacterium]|nr:exonuclease SbcCD subunit D [Actinomycetota bacterium]
MRFLHTGDWHVGKGLAGRSRYQEHEAALAEITRIAETHEVDLVLVAGDLFDHSSPPPEAERIVYHTLSDLARVAPVVVVAGNHDGDRRLEALAPLFKALGVHIRAFVSEEPLLIEASNGERARIATLPWLSQRHIVKAEQLMSFDADDLSGIYSERVRRIIEALCSRFDDSAINLLLGHTTIAGGELGGGERTAQTIFDYWVDTSAFPASAHYVALGHLHRPQAMAGACPVRYCGSPLQLDFSDRDEKKQVILVEASPGTPAEVTEVRLSSGRRLRTLIGTFEQIQAQAGTSGDDYLRVIVKSPARTGLGDEIRALFPHAVKVILDAPVAEGGRDRAAHTQVSPPELFSAFLSDQGVEDPALLDLFKELYEECVA